MELMDTVAIVTGAARGIGRGIAQELAREGAHVVIADLPSLQEEMERTGALVEGEGVQALLAHCDVTDLSQVSALASTTQERFGRIDILVNNAGVISIAPVVAMSEEAWERWVRERVPLGRPQTPADIGQAVVFLCRADNITGEALNVTGGSEMG